MQIIGNCYYQLYEYSCSYCGLVLKQIGIENEPQQRLQRACISEECPKCGSLIEKTLKRELKPSTRPLLQQQQQQQPSVSLSSPSSSLLLPLPTFQTADEINNRLTCDISKIDSLLNLKIGETVGVLGYTRYVQLFLTRLYVRSLLSERHGGLNSAIVITIDGGNCADIYQCVSFARQYGLDIKNVLQRIIVSRPFTIYQLAHLVINELPNIVRKFNTKLVVISDLLKMFVEDPQLNAKEAKMLLRQITSSIRNTSFNNNRLLFLISLPYHYNHNQSLKYNHFPLFDKHIEITKQDKETCYSVLDIKMINNRSEKQQQQHSKFKLLEKELIIITNR